VSVEVVRPDDKLAVVSSDECVAWLVAHTGAGPSVTCKTVSSW
jgi:hypothetical protein